MISGSVFNLIGYSYDPQSKDLRMVGKALYDKSTIEVTVHEPTQSFLMNAMCTYDENYTAQILDISLMGNVKE
jgi:hypothetical protein